MVSVAGGLESDADHTRAAWTDVDAPAAPAPGEGLPSLAAVLEYLYETTHTRARTVLRSGSAGLFLVAGGPYLARLSLTFLERLPGLAVRPLPVTIGRYDYRSGFVARRSTEDLAPFRRFEAILREIALEQRR